MRILTTLTYYSPHISGLTVYARRLIRELIEQGHEISVLTSHFEHELPLEEVIDGARIVRSPVAVRLSKGALMPLMPLQAARLVASHDLVHVHLPQFEASQVAMMARLLRKPVVATYHCDIEMPQGPARLAFTPAIRLSHYLTGKMASRIVVNSADYAAATRLPSRFRQKVVPIYPPVEISPRDEYAAREVARRLGTARPIIGFVGRFAEEKGIEFLIDALTLVRQRLPDARLALVGEWQQVPGEHVYERMHPRMTALGDAIVHLGVVSDVELRAFYDIIDVLALPSINSTESFGMTQAEAMLAGTPVVSTNLPGVREAISVTGMGVIIKPCDARALADGICSVLSQRKAYDAGQEKAAASFGTHHTAAAYEALFSVLGPRVNVSQHAPRQGATRPGDRV